MTETVLVRPRPARMLLITAAWGSCFVAIQWGLRDAPVLWFAAFRSILAGAVLVGVAYAQHRTRPHGIAAWRQISLLALFNVTIAFAAMFAAAAALSAGVAAVLSNAQPLLILLPAWWLFGERPRRSAGAAAAVGFVGLAITASASIGTTSGAALALLAATAITTGTLLARRLHAVDVVVVSAWHFLIGGAGLSILALLREGALRSVGHLDSSPHWHSSRWSARQAPSSCGSPKSDARRSQQLPYGHFSRLFSVWPSVRSRFASTQRAANWLGLYLSLPAWQVASPGPLEIRPPEATNPVLDEQKMRSITLPISRKPTRPTICGAEMTRWSPVRSQPHRRSGICPDGAVRTQCDAR